MRLYELKPIGARTSRAKPGAAAAAARRPACTPRRSRVDRARVFVGSFNFDPRSARLNTEMGLLLDSPALAARLAKDSTTPCRTWPMRCDFTTDDDVEWIERTPTRETRHTIEPATGFFRRAMVRVLSILPIEWLL